MGEVFVARTPWDEQPLAALKRLRPDVARVPTFAERFQHESELAVRLDHTNVVATLDVGSVDGQLYVASELILGKDIGLIADRLRERGQGGPAAVAIRILMDALSGLSYVHGVAEPSGRPLMLVHRDVTPGNLLVGYDGTARVADFGLAKSLLTEGSNLTQHGEILGTPHYLAPEVIRGDNASPASDLYGIGAVTYRFLTGVAPHHGTTAEVLLKVLQEEPRPLSDLRPDLPPWLVTFVHRLLEKDPSRRPQDAAALAEQLIRDAKRDGLFVARAQVGQWLVNLFEVEHAEELDEFERIAALSDEDAEPKPEGTVVLARPAQESRLHMPTPDAFREYEQSGGTELDLSEVEVKSAAAAASGGYPLVEEDADLPTRAVTVFPNGALVFDDGTSLEREDEREEDTLDPDTYDAPVADPANAATQWGEVVAHPQATAEVSPDPVSSLPGFVDGHHDEPRPDSYDPGITNPDPPADPAPPASQPPASHAPASEPGRRRRPEPDSVVVRPVAGSNPDPLPRAGPDEWYAETHASQGLVEPARTKPPSKPRPVVEARTRPPPGRDRRVDDDVRPEPAPERRAPPTPERNRRPPVVSEPRSERPRDNVAFTSSVPVPASEERKDTRSKNLVMAGALLAAAVALGVGIGAVVATVRARQEPPQELGTVTPPAEEPVVAKAGPEAARLVRIEAKIYEREQAGKTVPSKLGRKLASARNYITQEDREAASLLLDEIERTLAELPP